MKAKFLFIASTVILSMVTSGCNGTSVEQDTGTGLAGVSVSPTFTELVFGGIPNIVQLTAKPIPENITDVTFTYQSDHPGIASVSQTGLVKATGVGSTYITVTGNGNKSDVVRIRVVSDKSKYHNPVIGSSTPDPTVIRIADGTFYLYATEDIRNMPIYRSSDLVNWTYVTTVFTNTTRPTFEPNGGLWAPDINYIDGKYVLYYSMSVWGGEQTCGIGAAIANNPNGPFTDKGKLFRSNEIGVQNSIDPNYVEDDGKKYLFWGSFRGIYGIELSGDGLSVKAGSEKKQVAGTYYEGVYIHKRANYYYMFASIGSCCNGLNSTYTTVVGRSESLWGPYLNKKGESMMNNRHEVLIAKNSSFVGVGHNSEIVQDKAGNDWIFYHGYNVEDTSGRSLFLDRIEWVNDWPTVAGGTPSTEADIPVF